MAVALFGWYTSRETLPPEIRIAAGKRGGLNFTFAEKFAELLRERTGRPVRVMETKGTEADNVKLVRIKVKRSSPCSRPIPCHPKRIAGIAPLFTGTATHLIVRTGTGIRKVADLADKRVALGSKEVGDALAERALTVLQHHKLAETDVRDVEEPFGSPQRSGSQTRRGL